MTPKLWLRLLWLVLPAFAGCSLTPEYRRPESTAPAQWRNEAAEPAAVSETIAADWWKLYGSSELNRLMTEALANNYDLSAARQRIVQARAQAKIAGAPLWPAIDASGGFGYSAGDAAENDGGAWSGQWNMAYEVDLWGGLRAGRDAATARAETAQYTQQALRLVVMGDVAQRYFSILGLRERQRVAEDNIDNIAAVLDIIVARFEAGAASALEVAQQRTELANARAALALLAQQQAQAENALAVLLGRAPQQLKVEGKNLQTLALPKTDPLRPVNLFERRPDIRGVEAELIAAYADIGKARAAFFPRLELNAENIFAAASASQPAGLAVALTSALSQPIFQGGRLEGELERTQARREELVEIYRQTVLVAFREVEDALAAGAQSAHRRDALAVSVDSARQAYELARERYLSGATDFQTLLDVQRSLLRAADGKIQAQTDVLTASVLLFKALGGGWGER